MENITTYQDVWSLILSELDPIDLIPLQLVNKKLHEYIIPTHAYINRMDFLLGCMEYKLIESLDDYNAYGRMKIVKEAEYRIYCKSTNKPITYGRYVNGTYDNYYNSHIRLMTLQLKIDQFGFTIAYGKIQLQIQDKTGLTPGEHVLMGKIDGTILCSSFDCINKIH